MEHEQTETTGNIEVNRMQAQGLLARAQRQKHIEDCILRWGPSRAEDRAWELFRVRVDPLMTPTEVAALGKRCRLEAQAFEAAMKEVQPDGGNELMQEPGRPFAEAQAPSQRHRGIVGMDASRMTVDDVEGLAVEAEAFLEGGNRND